jgi:hypothetical protein
MLLDLQNCELNEFLFFRKYLPSGNFVIAEENELIHRLIIPIFNLDHTHHSTFCILFLEFRELREKVREPILSILKIDSNFSWAITVTQ